MKNYKILLISFVLLVFMIGAVSAGDVSDSALQAGDDDVVGDLPIITDIPVIDIGGGDIPVIDIGGGDDEGDTQEDTGVTPSGDIKEIYVNDTGNDSNVGSINSPYATIGKAISDCNDSHEATIYLSEGVFGTEDDSNFYVYLNHQLYGGNMKFIGAGTDKTFLDGHSLYRFGFFSMNTNVTFKDITFQNFRSDDNGGVLYSTGILTVENCIFKDSYTTGEAGGAISAGESSFIIIGGGSDSISSLVVRNSQFISTYVSYSSPFAMGTISGGAITTISLKKLVLDNNTFINNTVSSSNPQGAAVYTQGSIENTITNNKFINITGTQNSRDASIFIGTSNQYVSTFSNNTFINCYNPSQTYAVVYLNQGKFKFTNNTFINSTNSVGNIYLGSASPIGFTFKMDDETLNVTNSEINNGLKVTVNVTDDNDNIVVTNGYAFKFSNENNSYYFNPTINENGITIIFSEVPENGIYNLSVSKGREDITDALTTVNVNLTNDPVDVYISPRGFGGNDGTYEHPLETIQQALDYGFSKSFTVTVHLLEGTYTGDENLEIDLSYKGTINLIGEKYNETIIDGEFEHWFLSVAKTAVTTVENIKFVNGYAKSKNLIAGASCTLNNCIIDNCTVTRTSYDLLYNVIFNNLTYTNNNGRIGLNSKCGPITNCYFANNRYAGGDGGVFSTSNAVTIISNCKFINNTASGDGGAIRVSSLISSNNYYEGNSAQNGGVIYISNVVKTSTFKNDTFINNKAAKQNGVITFLWSSTIGDYPAMTFDDCKFINNSAETAGVLSLSRGRFTDCSFINNTADYGGVLRVMIKDANAEPDPGFIIIGASPSPAVGDIPIVIDIPIIDIDDPINIDDPGDGEDEEEFNCIEFYGVTFENNDARVNGKDIYFMPSTSYYLNTATTEYVYPIALTITFNDLNQSSLVGNLNATVYGPFNTIVGGNVLNFEIDGVKIGSAEIKNSVATLNYDGFKEGEYTIRGDTDYPFSNIVNDGKLIVKFENIVDSVEYWVSVNGSDVDGNGSQENPFASISHAVEKARVNSRNILIHLSEGVFAGDLNTALTLSSNNNLTIMGSGIDKTVIDGENNNTFAKITGGDKQVTISDLTIQNMQLENIEKVLSLQPYQFNTYSYIQRVMESLTSPIVIEEGGTLYLDNVFVMDNHGGKAIIESNGLVVINNSVFERNGIYAYGMIYGGDAVINNTLIDTNFGVNNFISAVSSLTINNSVIRNIFNTNGFSLISTKKMSVIENTLFLNDGDNTYLSILAGRNVTFTNLNPAVGINDNVTANNITMINNYQSPVTIYVYSYRHGAALSAFGYVYDREAKNTTVKNSRFYNFTNIFSINTQGNATFIFDGCVFNNLTWIGESRTPGVGSTITITNSVFLNTPLEVNRDNRGDREDPVCIFEGNYWGSNDKPVIMFANPGQGRNLSFEPATWIVLVDEDGIPVFKITDGEDSELYEGTLPAEISFIDDGSGDVIPVLNVDGDGYELSVDEEGNISINTEDVIEDIEPKYPVNESVFAEDITLEIGEETEFTAVFTDIWGDPLEDTLVTFIVDEEEINATTDEYGIASFEIPSEADLDLGIHIVNITNPVTGDNIIKTISVITNETVFADDISLEIDDETEFEALFTDIWGEPLEETFVTFIVDGEEINATTDEYGIASFEIPFEADLDLGIHIVNITNPVTGHNIVRTISVITNETVFAEDISLVIGEETEFTAVFTDIWGDPLEETLVTFIVDGEPIAVTTDDDGIASFEIPFEADLGLGIHNVTVINPITGQTINNTVTVYANETVSAEDLEVTSGDGSKLTAVFKDKFGQVLKEAAVQFIVDGVAIDATTDENGVASIEITFAPGEHNVTVYNPVTGEMANHTLSIAAAQTNETNGTGNTNGTDTNATAGNTTDAQTPTTETQTPAAETTAAPAKATAKITAKNKTFKAKVKVKKYTITLKSGKKAIKKAKVTLKIKGKTYKATTNAKGKATFKIKKLTKKGKYTAKIKFAGNASYKAANKNVKITIK